MDLPCGCKTEYNDYNLLLKLKSPCEKHKHASQCFTCNSKNISILILQSLPPHYIYVCEKTHQVMRFHGDKY